MQTVVLMVTELAVICVSTPCLVHVYLVTVLKKLKNVDIKV
jgi:hypothetical protein